MPIFGYHKQFADKVERGEKRQTIRIGWKRIPKPGDIGYHYTGPYNENRRKLGEWPITDVQKITIKRQGVIIKTRDLPEQRISHPIRLDIFAQADGFECWEQMRAYFLKNGGLPAEGHLIRW